MELTVTRIPIHRLSPTQLQKEKQRDRQKYLRFYRQWAEDHVAKGGSEESANETIDCAEQRWYLEKDYDWSYNEVVGWLELNLNRSKLTADLWFVNKRISKRLKDRRYVSLRKQFELFFASAPDNTTVSNRILSRLDQWVKSDNLLKRRHIDRSDAYILIATMDWLNVFRYLNRDLDTP